MPQDGSNNYQYPPGTPGIPDTTIESEAYNTFLDDLVINDLNIPRPVHRGGTGASTADQALINLKAEKAEQVVAAYLPHVWMPGSFRSAIGATDAPVADHAFAGVCYINEPLVYPPTNANVTVEARDMTNSKLYVRQKTAGVWGAWLEQAGGLADLDAAYVNIAGDTMTGLLTLSGPPTVNLHAATKQYVDGGIDGVTGGLASKAPFDAMAYSGLQINGGMEVSQELGTTGRSSNGYICDGWRTDFGGSMTSGAAQQLALTTFPGFVYCLLANTGTAQPSLGANDFSMIGQPIEGYRIVKLAWGTANARSITIGFWSAHTPVGLYSVMVQNSPITHSYVATYTQAVAGVAQFNVITIPGPTVGTWAKDYTRGMTIYFARASGTTYIAPSANTWTAGNFIAASGQVNGVAANPNNFILTGVVILPGTQAPTAAQSPLLTRPYDQELQTCKRYWQKAALNIRFFSSTGAGEIGEYSYSLSPEMRAVPTVALFAAGSGANTVSFGYIPTDTRTLKAYMTSANPVVDCIVHDYIYSADARL